MKSKRLTKKRRVLQRYSAEDRERLIRKYHASGQSKAAFCRSEQLNLGTFCGWLGRYATGTAGFAEVVMSDVAIPSPIAAAPDRIEVRFPDGVCVLLPSQGSAAKTGQLIREVAGYRMEAV